MLVVSFSNNQLRAGLFPVLEEPWTVADDDDNVHHFAQTIDVRSQDREIGSDADEWGIPEAPTLIPSSGDDSKVTLGKRGFLTYQQDPTAVVQTGPGLPRWSWSCLLYTSPSPRDGRISRMPSSA